MIRDPSTHQVLKLGSARGEARYLLPVGANIVVRDGDEIQPGMLIAKIPRETAKTKDITGGLPRVAELFEARQLRDLPSSAKSTDGWNLAKIRRASEKSLFAQARRPKEYLIAKGKALAVRPGDRVQADEPLMDGAANPHDILRVLGDKELAKFLVDEIQEVYRLQRFESMISTLRRSFVRCCVA